MYCEFYGFKERPFNVTSDPSFFFLSEKHKEAVSHLVYGVSQRKGIMVLTGEIGTGKTTLCRFFLNQLPSKIKSAFILNPYFSELELLEAIVRDFGIKIKNASRLGLIGSLNKFLLQESRNGNNILLIIDEAQNLKPHMLEQIRLLSNLETEKEKLLQIILVGQPELNQRLNLDNLRQLRQRIMVRFHISPLAREEIQGYISHRLSKAQGHTAIEFTAQALDAIAQFSQGTPRLINMLCDRALLAGFITEKHTIDAEIINRCLEELDAYAVGEKQ